MLMRSATFALLVVGGTSTCTGGQCVNDVEGDEVGLLSVRTGSMFGPIPPAPSPAPKPPKPIQLCKPCEGDDCISNPGDYQKQWEAYSKESGGPMPLCVNPRLFGSVTFGKDTLYKDEAQKAWIFSKADLEMCMYLQWQYGKENPAKIAAGLFIIVGFGPPGLSGDIEGAALEVFTLPAPGDAPGLVPKVPSLAYWFRFMSTQGYDFDLSVQKELIIKYSQLGVGGKLNVLDVFHGLTDCSVEWMQTEGFPDDALPKGWTGKGSNCSTSSLNVFKGLGDLDQAGTLPQKKGDSCVGTFYENADKKWDIHNLGDVRMMLFRCFNINPFNTCVGLGWNSYPNPLVCKTPSEMTNDDLYTGEEFVIDNHPGVSAYPEKARIELPKAPADESKTFIENGFCDA